MTEIEITIEGTTALLMNKFTTEAQMAASSGTRSSVVGDKGTPREQAEAKVYTDHSGSPAVPVQNLFRCIIDAGKFHKYGKSKVTTQKSSLIPACVSIEGGATVAVESDEPWEVFSTPVRIPSTGGRILCHRPLFENWRLRFVVMLDESMIAAKTFRQIVDDAGQRIGLGDFRPDCKGPFGKFKVTRWQVVKEGAAVAA